VRRTVATTGTYTNPTIPFGNNMASPLSSTTTTAKTTTTATQNVFQGFDHYSPNDASPTPSNGSSFLLSLSSSSVASSSSSSSSSYFTPKFQWSTKNNPICGICSRAWFQLLYHRRHHIEWTVYWPRLLVVTALSLFNSILSLVEDVLYQNQIQDTVLHPSPVFVLGHPRTGTTLLHSLLALDEHQFATCTTFCAGFPSCFLWFESIGKRLFANVMDATRPMDQVKLHFDLPQEDELATNVLSLAAATANNSKKSGPIGPVGVSPYMALFFMSHETDFRPYYAFDDDTTISDTTHEENNSTIRVPGDNTKETKDDNHHHHQKTSNNNDDQRLAPDQMALARRTWTTAFLYLLKKLTLRSQLRSSTTTASSGNPPTPPCRLVLKSPVHTARIPLLVQLFPQAQFIYIHRHPYDVLQSAMHMADTTYWYTYLSTPTNEEILEFILRQYEILWDRYEAGRMQLQENYNCNNRNTTASTTDHDHDPQPQPPLQQQSLIEVSFDDLTKDPIAVMERIYQQLGWTLSPTYRQRLHEELKNEVQGYQRNSYPPLAPELQAMVQQRWGASLDRLGYAR
jgi:omega-hydroxy-beta-dihydromenaquinone-9 sulfotransferase